MPDALPAVVKDQSAQKNFDALHSAANEAGSGIAAVEKALAALPKTTSGTATAEFEAGNSFSKETTVAHGLGKEPTAIHLTSKGGGGFFGDAIPVDATNFKFIAYDLFGAPGAGVKAPFYWTASV